jgi:signal transduction histidine kinase
MNPIEIEQVVVNLIHNAVHAGAHQISVRVEEVPSSDRVVVRIRDDGCGIDDETLPKIFDPFFSTRLNDGGTGLGLSVAHGIVGSHGGEMKVESELGIGTTISFELPFERA